MNDDAVDETPEELPVGTFRVGEHALLTLFDEGTAARIHAGIRKHFGRE